MTCSRCGSQWPNAACYVCAEEERDEPDAFAEAKEYKENSEWEEVPA